MKKEFVVYRLYSTDVEAVLEDKGLTLTDEQFEEMLRDIQFTLSTIFADYVEEAVMSYASKYLGANPYPPRPPKSEGGTYMINLVLVEFVDVWGNKDDGYIVNEQTVRKKNVTVADMNGDTLLQVLKDVGFLKQHVTLEDIYFVDWKDNVIDIVRVSDDRPLGCFEYE